MKKNALARKILCGLLAAGVVGACGSALAAEYTSPITKTTVDNDERFTMTVKDEGYPMDAYTGKKITVNSKYINITSTSDKDMQLVGADSWSAEKLTLGNSSTDKISIIVNNTFKGLGYSSSGNALQTLGLVSNGANSDVEVTAKEFTLIVNGDRAIAINVGNNTQLETAPDNAAKMTVNADKIDITSSSTGIAVYSNGQFTLNGDLTINTENAPAFEVRGNSTSNINADGNHKTVINGDINFGTPNEQGGDGHNSGNIIDATLNINFSGDGSSWTGKAYQELGTTTSIDIDTNRPYYGDAKGLNVTFADGAAWNMTGDSFVNSAKLEDGGIINVSENVSNVNVEKMSMANGSVNLQGENQKVNVLKELSGEGTVATNSLTNNVSLTSAAAAGGAAITVQGTGAIGDAIAADNSNAQKLANVVSTGEGEEVKSAATKITTQEGKVAGAYTADVKDGAVVMNSLQSEENTTNRAISDMASISLMTWRAENNDMNKRLGELRDSKGEHGAWARMARGESKYGAQNVKNQYNYYQVGYDEKLSVNPNWTVGVALTRTEGTSTFTNGSGENKHTGFAVYGSYLADNGSFLDLIAKYARMDNDYKTVTGAGSGDYETNGYSLSAEYGKRFTKDNGFWIEPQVELTYGKVSSADYLTANKVQVHQGDMNSFVGRLGFSLGKDIKQGNVYVRASYLYDFDGETDVKMIDTVNGAPASYKQDLGGGWWEVGVGTNLNLSDATHLYFDVEKTYGGNVATPWQWNAGVRWSF